MWVTAGPAVCGVAAGLPASLNSSLSSWAAGPGSRASGEAGHKPTENRNGPLFSTYRSSGPGPQAAEPRPCWRWSKCSHVRGSGINSSLWAAAARAAVDQRWTLKPIEGAPAARTPRRPSEKRHQRTSLRWPFS